MWHMDQKSICAFVFAVVKQAQRERGVHILRMSERNTFNTTSIQPARPMRTNPDSCPRLIAAKYKREREREIHYVHWASKAYEDECVFMPEAHLGWQ